MKNLMWLCINFIVFQICKSFHWEWRIMIYLWRNCTEIQTMSRLRQFLFIWRLRQVSIVLILFIFNFQLFFYKLKWLSFFLGLCGNWIEIAYGTRGGSVRVIVQHPETVGHGPQLFQTFTVHQSPVTKVKKYFYCNL